MPAPAQSTTAAPAPAASPASTAEQPLSAPTGCPPPAVAVAVPRLEPVEWTALPGWRDDRLDEAWPAFLASCRAIATKPEWRAVCAAANAIRSPDSAAVREFFETHFVPHRVFASVGAANGAPNGTPNAAPAEAPIQNDSGLVTGYYEPLLRGSRTRTAPYLTALYRPPDDLLTVDLAEIYPQLKGMRLRGRLVAAANGGKKVVPYPTRAELESGASLRGKEIVWVDDPVEAFFLQVQGSGRVRLYDRGRPGETIRLAYADQNGQPYRSIGRYLAERGELPLEQVSMQSIRDWARAHPDRLAELFNANPSVVFFNEARVGDPAAGPNGALGVPLTPRRSIAVDPKVVPLGAPVFLATSWPNSDEPLRKLTMAQDTGGAIAAQNGSAVRADYFWGFGEAAGEQAGRMKQQGRMWVLLPR